MIRIASVSRALFFPQSSLLCKEIAQQPAALGTQQAREYLGLVVHPRIGQQPVERLDSPRLRIGRPVDDPRQTGLQNGPRAHRAGFERHVERAAGEPPAADRFGRLRDGDHLGMGRRVTKLFPLVVRGGYELAILHDHRPDRHVARGLRLTGLLDGELHVVLVFAGIGGQRLGDNHGILVPGKNGGFVHRFVANHFQRYRPLSGVGWPCWLLRPVRGAD